MSETMPHSGKSMDEMTHDSLGDRFRDSLIFGVNKPDFKELDLGSPVSPLLTRGSSGGGGGTAAATSICSSCSSSGSVSAKASNPQMFKRSDNITSSHSCELSRSSEANQSQTFGEGFRSVATTQNSIPGHRRSKSTGPPLIFSGGSFISSSTSGSSVATNNSSCCNNGSASSVTSNPNSNMLPSGNICPSGKILKTGMACRSAGRTDVLGTGTGNYGHGSVMRGGAGKLGVVDAGVTGNSQFAGDSVMVKKAMASSDAEEVKKAGNEQYRKRHFADALSLYDRAIALSPDIAAYRSNRAAALTALGKLGEAVTECEEAVRLDPGYGRAHQRLASLYLRMGQVENARRHLCIPAVQPDPVELQKLHALEKHLNRCADARKIGDWKSVLRECDAAMVAGTESSPQLLACKAEAFLKLHQLEDADSILSNISKFEPYLPSSTQVKFFGMLSEAYMQYVQAQVDMAMGRFENAVAAAEKAGLIDYINTEVARLLNNVKLVARARARGNDLFSSGRFAEACSAYGEGLIYDSSSYVLYCNRAVCWSKLGLWEQSVEDCNQALKIQPNYIKALLRRAVSNGKLERWAEAVRDYEILKRELPGDNEVSESLIHAQNALKKLHGEEVHHMKFGGKIEEISGLDRFKTAISSPGIFVVHFKATSNQQCEQISPFIDNLCGRYPSVNFLKVDVERSPALAKAESIKIVPTFKIYKNGGKVKEMICPSHQVLEYSVRHYGS
ncbi:inactive TPR repeat-containing thioredoxin TTL3-like [Malania oleifera]|uniref:inactive TPR repeat-containing thioredoxin TTL3-like n=1 Tax=Malania oleifera TaxID=397392 RepID=UPI0025AE1863|nr:inactive TPR repeat-containing thioredoxin TTL3-like [Malania oleifera]XP_057956319.1 inactive TPR repeat-containing thioredoxin TTL3-like [Malania oleifera]